MTGIVSTDGERRLVLISGRAHPQLAEDVARELGRRAGADHGLRLRQR